MKLGEFKKMVEGLSDDTDTDELVLVGYSLLGRVIDATGKSLDGYGDIEAEAFYPLLPVQTNSIKSAGDTCHIETGIAEADEFLKIKTGQQLAIFGGSGVGKSTLLEMIWQKNNYDINVIVLIDRNREISEFINNNKDNDIFKRSVVIVSESSEEAACRARVAFTAMAIAEYFRDKGNRVLVLFDCLNRFYYAWREAVAVDKKIPQEKDELSASIFDVLHKLFARAGITENGSITAIYTELCDSDDLQNPNAKFICDQVDGYIVLSRKLAIECHYPAIDLKLSKKI